MTRLDSSQVIEQVTPNAQQGVGSPPTTLRQVAWWLVLFSAVLIAGAFVIGGSLTIWSGQPWLMQIAQDHFAATIGLPCAALVAFCIVLFLEHSSGTIEFEGLGFKFKGASGPIVLWVFCFLAIAGAVRLLW